MLLLKFTQSQSSQVSLFPHHSLLFKGDMSGQPDERLTEQHPVKTGTVCNARRDCHGQLPNYLLQKNYFCPPRQGWGPYSAE